YLVRCGSGCCTPFDAIFNIGCMLIKQCTVICVEIFPLLTACSDISLPLLKSGIANEILPLVDFRIGPYGCPTTRIKKQLAALIVNFGKEGHVLFKKFL